MTTETTTQVEYEEVEVELTMDNVNDYIEVIIVNEVNAFGKETGFQYPLSISKVYEDGLILKNSKEFAIEYQFEGYTSIMPTPYTFINYAGDVSIPIIVDVKGTLVFVEEKYVTEYYIDNNNRHVTFSNGTGVSGYVYDENYPY